MLKIGFGTDERGTMLEAPILPDEALRLETLRRLSLLDSEAEERFDRLTRMARRVFNVPIALVSLVDEDRQWFKSCAGMELSETPRDISFCGHAILGDGAFVIPDTLQDERFCDNPLVTGPPHVRFYAGCPLRGPGGRKLGSALLWVASTMDGSTLFWWAPLPPPCCSPRHTP